MLKHPTLDQLHALGLYGMAKAFAELSQTDEAKDLDRNDWLALLLDREASLRPQTADGAAARRQAAPAGQRRRRRLSRRARARPRLVPKAR